MFPTRTRRLLAAAIATLLVARSAAEPVDARFDRRTWETDDGLPHNIVNSILQRRDGFLWLATQGGLVRFDGLQFKKWRSPLLADERSAGIRSVIEEDSQSLLVASDKSGLLRLKNGTLTVHPITAQFRPEHRIFWLFRESDGVFWILFTNRELWRCHGPNVEVFPTPAGGDILSPASFAWTTRGEIFLTRGNSVEKYANGQLSPANFPTGKAAAVCSSANGGLWIASADRLYRSPDGIALIPQGEHAPWPGGGPPNAILEARDGSLWFGLRSQGLLHWKSGRVEEVPTSHPRISELREDDEGNVWAATAGGGANRIRQARFTTFGEEAGLLTDIAGSVCEDSAGQLWFANRNGIGKIHDGRLELMSGLADWPKKALGLCLDREGTLWMAAINKVYRLPAGSEGAPIEAASTEAGSYHAMFASRDGSVWVAGDGNAILRFHNAILDTYGAAQGYTGEQVRAIGEDSAGHGWVGTATGKLFEFVNGRFRQYGAAQGLPSSPIRAIYGDSSGTLWIGTGGAGIVIRENGKFSVITENQGLPDDVISQLLEDDDHGIWIGSSRALFTIKKADLLDCAAGRIARVTPISFGKADGLSGFSATANYQPATLKTKSGELWFVSRKGLVVTRPDRQTVRPSGLKVAIERMLVNGQPVMKGRAEFPSVSRNLEFQFTAPTFVAPEKVQFRHRLKGFGQDWTDPDPQRSATYSSLAPGHYEFQVIACDSDLNWSTLSATMPFEILPMWWETWWARTAGALIAAAALGSAVAYWSRRRYQARLARLEAHRRLELERTRIARDLHDDLGASLTQAGMLAEELCEDCEDLALMKAQSSELVQRVRTIARDLDAAVWAVSPKNDSLASLCAYLCQFALEYFRSTPIRCLVDMADNLPGVPLSPEVRHHLFLTAKEAMNNSLKHSHATQVTLALRLDGDDFELVFADDGCGFCVSDAESSPRNGLRNMRARLREIGGELHVDSTSRGTTIRICFPLKAAQNDASTARAAG